MNTNKNFTELTVNEMKSIDGGVDGRAIRFGLSLISLGLRAIGYGLTH